MRTLRDLRSVETSPSGRVANVELVCSDGSWRIGGNRFRLKAGADRIRSTFFQMQVRDGRVYFSGRGVGHGVGMSQWGAREMAQQGFGYRQILAHYYPGTHIDVLR